MLFIAGKFSTYTTWGVESPDEMEFRFRLSSD